MRSRRWTGSSVTVVERRSSTIRGPLRTAISRRGESSIGSAAGRRSPLDGSGAAGVTPAVDYDGPAGRSGGMADAAGSNTAGGNLIRVRIPASAPRTHPGLGDLVGGQAEPELAAAARPAFGPHPAAHPGDEMAAHEQPDPGACGLVRHRGGPEEQVEEAARLGLVDPGALVEHG